MCWIPELLFVLGRLAEALLLMQCRICILCAVESQCAIVSTLLSELSKALTLPSDCLHSGHRERGRAQRLRACHEVAGGDASIRAI